MVLDRAMLLELTGARLDGERKFPGRDSEGAQANDLTCSMLWGNLHVFAKRTLTNNTFCVA